MFHATCDAAALPLRQLLLFRAICRFTLLYNIFCLFSAIGYVYRCLRLRHAIFTPRLVDIFIWRYTLLIAPCARVLCAIRLLLLLCCSRRHARRVSAVTRCRLRHAGRDYFQPVLDADAYA